MTSFTSELLQIPKCRNDLPWHGTSASHSLVHHTTDRQPSLVFRKGDETMLLDLEANGAISIVLHAMYRFLGLASPNFFNSAAIALVHMVFKSRARSRTVYKQGGLGCIVEMMRTYRSVDYIQMIGIAALMVIGKNVGICLFDLEHLILHQIVLAMEFHQQSTKVYTVACSALGSLLGPQNWIMRPCFAGSAYWVSSHRRESYALFHRSLKAITHGLVLHPDDALAQEVGNALLCNMVGPSVAEDSALGAAPPLAPPAPKR